MTKTNEAGKAAKTNNRRTGVRYRRSAVYVKELTPYIEALSDPQREFLMHRVQRIIIRAISQSLHINVSTICRNIQRGEQKMNRVLEFARALLGDQAA